MSPGPPARLTAVASSAVETTSIGAETMGCSIPKRSVKRVCRVITSPSACWRCGAVGDRGRTPRPWRGWRGAGRSVRLRQGAGEELGGAAAEGPVGRTVLGDAADEVIRGQVARRFQPGGEELVEPLLGRFRSFAADESQDHQVLGPG